MEPSLSRTASVESTRSWLQLSTAGGSSPAAAMKARSSEPETGGAAVGRASVSVPPSGAQAIRQFPSRRTSKASDSFLDLLGYARSNAGSAIEEADAPPALEGTRASLAPVNALMLPEALRQHRSDFDTAESSKRLSFSSLLSFGSAIYGSNRGHSWSGRSSIAGSDTEGRSCTELRVPPASD
jgi:inositol hexakisphosphate/diphosphoinositol-pentakisphosphate kinase